MPAGMEPTAEISRDKAWTLGGLHKQIGRAVKLGLSGPDLHYTRCLLGRVVAGVAPRDHAGEITAIHTFVKDGGTLRGAMLRPDPLVIRTAGGRRLELPPMPWQGLRYTPDPWGMDAYPTLLRSIEAGLGDCDDAAACTTTLAACAGYPVGIAYCAVDNDLARGGGEGVRSRTGGAFNHVYGVAKLPGDPPDPRLWTPMETTVRSAYVGWRPPAGRLFRPIVVKVIR